MSAEKPSVRNQKLLAQLDGRNQLIPKLIKGNEVYRPRTEFGRFLGWFLATTCISPESVFVGHQNIEEAIKAYQGGASIAVASNHESDADHTVRRFGMTRNGYGEYADKIVYAAGLKMRERWYINPFSAIESQLYTPTPMDGDALSEARILNKRLYSAAERAAMKQLSRNYHDLIDVAQEKAGELIKPGPDGLWFGVYPESTRTRDGKLGQARKETANWFTDRPDGFVLPMAVSGGPKLLPAEEIMLLHQRFVRDRAQTEVHVGSMISTRELIAFSETFRNPKQVVVDCVMAHVAVLIGSKRVSPERWEHLAQVKSDFDNFRGQQRRLNAALLG